MPTNHTPACFFEFGYATPLALVAGAALLAHVLKRCCGPIWRLVVLETEEKKFDEGLPNFYRTVKLSDADWLISMNQHYEREYGLRMVSKELTSRLDANKSVTKPIQGFAWYNMLANREYDQDFAYIDTNNEKRAELIVDDDDNEGNDCEQSDLVALILNLAFVKESVARDLVFGAGAAAKVKQHAG